MKHLDSIRDELARGYVITKYPVQNIETRKDFTQDINFSRRMSHCQAFHEGFTAAVKELEPMIKELVEVLEKSEKIIYDSTEFYSHYDDCPALICDEDDPDYKCTCGMNNEITKTIDIRFLIKEKLEKYKEMMGEK